MRHAEVGGARGGSQGPVDEARELRRVYWEIVEATGWTFSEIDRLTGEDVAGLYEAWTSSPPMAVAVKAYLGIRPSGEPRPTSRAPAKPIELTEQQFAALVAETKAFARQHGGS